MNAILISIQPQWVEKILNGEKTIEIRKTIPKCKLPCKVYIYCTKNERKYFNSIKCCESVLIDSFSLGKVVAEFTLKNIVKFDIESIIFMGKHKELMQKSCLGGLSLRKYLGNKTGYSWGIDKLKIYKKPKALSEFYTIKKCNSCKISGYESSACRFDEDCRVPVQIIKPPQSWCYVNDLEENYEL